MSGFSVSAPNTSVAWLRAVEHLLACGGQCSNLMVQIAKPIAVDASIQQAYEELVSKYQLLTVKQVTYTIFPHSLYQRVHKDPAKLFERYNRIGGIYERLKRRGSRKFGWGSYFRRMTHYTAVNHRGRITTTNQLREIVEMLSKRGKRYKAAYTISLQIPCVDGRRVRGGPCLNYLALQLANPGVLNMLAVFRSHEFIERAYGNYLGLGFLMDFICDQTGYTLGTLNCLSSYATISDLAGRRRTAGGWPSVAELSALVKRLKEYGYA